MRRLCGIEPPFSSSVSSFQASGIFLLTYKILKLSPLLQPSQESGNASFHKITLYSAQRRRNTPCQAVRHSSGSVSFHFQPKLCEGFYYFFRPLFLNPAPSFSGGGTMPYSIKLYDFYPLNFKALFLRLPSCIHLVYNPCPSWLQGITNLCYKNRALQPEFY